MHVHDLNSFFNGAIFMGEIAVALLFLRFRSKTADRLFGWFAIAFFLLALERIFLIWTLHDDFQPIVYVTRLLAFGCIIFGVADRNRRSE